MKAKNFRCDENRVKFSLETGEGVKIEIVVDPVCHSGMTAEEFANHLANPLKPSVATIDVEWVGKCDRRKFGKPYLAVITPGNENGKKYQYTFLPTVEEWDRKGKDVKATYQGKLPVGTILKGRENASWGNDYSYFYRVEKGGLVKIEENEVLKSLGILK